MYVYYILCFRLDTTFFSDLIFFNHLSYHENQTIIKTICYTVQLFLDRIDNIDLFLDDFA
jgi:hypothetical protein